MEVTNKKKKLLFYFTSLFTILVLVFAVLFNSNLGNMSALAFNTRGVANPADYTTEFYCRTIIDGEEKFLTYSGGTELTVADPQSSAPKFSITFTSNDTIKITIDNHSLGYKGISDTKLENKDCSWVLTTDHLLRQSDGERLLLYSFQNKYVRAYSGSVGNSYSPVYFYTANEFTAASGRCQWGAGSDRETQLSNLAYPVPAKYTVSFDANGGTGTMQSLILVENTILPLPECTFTAPSGMTFDYWSLGGVKQESAITITGNITLVANWKIEEAPEVYTSPVTFTAGTDTGATSVTKGPITISMSTMSRTDNYRTYAGTNMVIEAASGYIITEVDVTCTGSGTSDYGPGKFSSSGYTYSGKIGTWAGSSQTIILTASTQVRMTKIVVTFSTSN